MKRKDGRLAIHSTLFITHPLQFVLHNSTFPSCLCLANTLGKMSLIFKLRKCARRVGTSKSNKRKHDSRTITTIANSTRPRPIHPIAERRDMKGILLNGAIGEGGGHTDDIYSHLLILITTKKMAHLNFIITQFNSRQFNLCKLTSLVSATKGMDTSTHSESQHSMIVVTGATPCVQQTMIFSDFTPGIVNRAHQCKKVCMHCVQ